MLALAADAGAVHSPQRGAAARGRWQHASLPRMMAYIRQHHAA
eukprot:COSAG06_NODE_2096_length_7603_cov_8.520656_2_plen_43_part_00